MLWAEGTIETLMLWIRILTSYAVEYTFEDGSTFQLNGPHHDRLPRPVCQLRSWFQGSGDCIDFFPLSGPLSYLQRPEDDASQHDLGLPQPEKNPYQLEWDDLLDAIRNDKPYNEIKRGATASLVTSMGRMAAHTGQEVTFDQILNSDHEFAPNLDKLTMTSDAPLRKNADGKYPIPQPGIVRDREYQEEASA